MKGSSKYEQIRLLREASLGRFREPDVVHESARIVPNLAPLGQCESCDKRRAALYAMQAKRRAAERARRDE